MNFYFFTARCLQNRFCRKFSSHSVPQYQPFLAVLVCTTYVSRSSLFVVPTFHLFWCYFKLFRRNTSVFCRDIVLILFCFAFSLPNRKLALLLRRGSLPSEGCQVGKSTDGRRMSTRGWGTRRLNAWPSPAWSTVNLAWRHGDIFRTKWLW